jgi:hypothetical protein
MVRENPFVRLLASYCPSPENEAAFDESVQTAKVRFGVELPWIQHPLLDELLSLLNKEEPPSIILTGTAGDGKTALCRQLHEGLGGRPTSWGDPIVKVYLPAGRPLVIVKDFTELGDHKQMDIVMQLSKVVYGGDYGREQPAYLVAANEGILSQKTNPRESPSAGKNWLHKLHDDLKNMLTSGKVRSSKDHLCLYNLSQLSGVDNLEKVLKEVLEHQGWGVCQDCSGGASSDVEMRCVIFENRQRLCRPTIQRRLRNLVEVAEYNDEHLTIRHVLMLVANALVGYEGAAGPVKAFTKCSNAVGLGESERLRGAYYQNIFGANLPRAIRGKPFTTLDSMGVGRETNNRIDSVVIYGDLLGDDQAQSYKEVMLSDPYYGETEVLTQHRADYREGLSPSPNHAFLQELVAQRRRLYFELPDTIAENLGHSDLTVFRTSGRYRQDVVAQLRLKKSVPSSLLQALVVGMNRVFVGALLETNDKILLATSGAYSHRRSCNLVVHCLAHNAAEKLGIAIGLNSPDQAAAIPRLEVYDSRGQLAQLLLTMSRFEFLVRVAQGALPGSLSTELYEDLIAFKAQLLNSFLARPDVHPPICLLKVALDGAAEFEDLEVK